MKNNTIELLKKIKIVDDNDFVAKFQSWIMDKYYGSVEDLPDDVAIYVDYHSKILWLKRKKYSESVCFWANNERSAIQFLSELAADDDGKRTGSLYLAAMALVLEYFDIDLGNKAITESLSNSDIPK